MEQIRDHMVEAMSKAGMRVRGSYIDTALRFYELVAKLEDEFQDKEYWQSCILAKIVAILFEEQLESVCESLEKEYAAIRRES